MSKKVLYFKSQSLILVFVIPHLISNLTALTKSYYILDLSIPHLSNIALLNHGMSAGHDLNIIAAIIVPLDEKSLDRKLSQQDGALKFTKAERVRLWQGDSSPSDNYWTFD